MPVRRLSLGITLLVLTACQQALAPDQPTSPLEPDIAAAPAPLAPNACAPQPDGVIAWWHGDGDGTDAVGGHDASPVGAVGYAPGHQGQAFALDGASYLTVPDDPALDLASSFTLDFWFQPQSGPGTWWFEGLVGKRDPGTDVANFGVNLNPDFLGLGPYYNDPLAVGGDDFDQAGSTFEAVRVLPTPTTGVFHHFAAVYRQASTTQIELRMFVDGAMVRARTIDGVLARTVNGAPLTLGASYPGFETFTGLLDEVRIFDRALSDDEVSGLAGATAAPCRLRALSIDVLPGNPDNRLPCQNPRALVTVAVLTTDAVDATTLDPNTARFGPSQAAEVHRDPQGDARVHLEDVNGDGRLDLVLHFRLGETGLDCQATDATLEIADRGGAEYQGTDTLTPSSR